MIYSISALPVSGSIYQLSQVFSMYGYEPKKGVQILSSSTAITGSDNRLLYTRPNPDQAGTEKVLHNGLEVCNINHITTTKMHSGM